MITLMMRKNKISCNLHDGLSFGYSERFFLALEEAEPTIGAGDPETAMLELDVSLHRLRADGSRSSSNWR